MKTTSTRLKVPNSARRNRGSTLIEMLVAIAIVSLLVVGVLQTFSVALLQGNGAGARTQLTYKCQQVVEVIRLTQYLGAQAAAQGAPPPSYVLDSGIGYPLSDTKGFVALPYTGGETNQAFWGPTSSNIVDRWNDAYRLFYSVEPLPDNWWQVCVTAFPADSPGLPVKIVTPKTPYLGAGSKLKRVDYVAQIAPPPAS